MSRAPSIPAGVPGAAVLPLALLALLLLPGAGRAQLGAVEAFARRVTDLSFYFTTGGLAGGSAELATGDFGLSSYGVELLFSVGEVTRRLPRCEHEERRSGSRDSVELVWTGMEVVRSTGGGVDTVYTYDVRPTRSPPPPTETIWYLEMGIGYGQLQGFEMEDPTLEMRGAIRDLPAVSLYASYEPLGSYLGLRTGFMKTQALQVVQEGAEGTFSGRAEAFLFGAVLGHALPVETLNFFLEGGYTLRYFPSVEWSGPGALPDGVPRDLNVSGWSISAGVQFGFR